MTSSELIVSLRDVGKQYVKYEDVPTLVAGVMRRQWRNRRSRIWAVRHVNLEVARGQSVGVIGRNGAGKSTMLAMLAGVTAPTEGTVVVKGRVAPLLRLGVGFHDELTGRENVYINATILGMSEPEIDRVFDEVVGFAELAEFIDTPVKFYSSGMQARLGFSVAVFSRPDVLIVDEVLAVGDVAFQARSFDRMMELRTQGATILVVSHNLESIRRLCGRVLVLDSGTPHYEGPAPEAIGRYHDLLKMSWDEVGRGRDEDAVEASDAAPVEILECELVRSDGSPSAKFEDGETMTVRMRVRFRRAVDDPIAGIWVTNVENVLVYGANSFGNASGHFDAGAEARFDVQVVLNLVGGTYAVGSWVGWGETRVEHVRAPSRALYVSSQARRGIANLNATYCVTDIRPSDAQTLGDSSAATSDPRTP
jgi:ABC-2 type transport system ATP-binding protein